MPGEVELSSDTATVTVRALPMRGPAGQRGSLVLVRDVTELRRRERALLSKDATIREIHHRVKNNLQTVAALLRLQARRLDEPGAAAALAEAERRVGAIAVVHDLLAQASTEEVPFDAVADRLVTMVRQTSAPDMGAGGSCARDRSARCPPSRPRHWRWRSWSCWPTRSSMARTTWSCAALATTVGLHVVVSDRGPGFPEGFEVASSPRLGLRIVDTLVREELNGTLTLGRVGEPTEVAVDLPPEQR